LWPNNCFIYNYSRFHRTFNHTPLSLRLLKRQKIANGHCPTSYSFFYWS